MSALGVQGKVPFLLPVATHIGSGEHQAFVTNTQGSAVVSGHKKIPRNGDYPGDVEYYKINWKTKFRKS